VTLYTHISFSLWILFKYLGRERNFSFARACAKGELKYTKIVLTKGVGATKKTHTGEVSKLLSLCLLVLLGIDEQFHKDYEKG